MRNALVTAASRTACADVTAVDLAAITRLDLYGLASLQAGDFDGLTGSTELYLGGNSLSSLPAGVFDGLTSLLTLGLDFNLLSSLPAGVFDGLTDLLELYLYNNSLSSLPVGVFDGLTSLQNLWLYNNSLSSLPAGVFDGLTSLTLLYLNGNSLSSLPVDVFDGLTSLTLLDLEGNSLSSLPVDVFDGLTSLRLLYLNGNSLSSLPAGVFDGLTSLTRLWLHDNSLSSLPAGAFSDLASLTWLYLDGNSLSSLPAGAFTGLASLTRLWLHENPGSPFLLPLQLERLREGTTTLPAIVVGLRAAAGAPFAMPVDLQIEGATPATGTVTIARGASEAELSLTRTANRPVRVRVATPPALPTATCSRHGAGDENPCYSGIAVEAAPEALVLFERVSLHLEPDEISENGGAAAVTATVSPPSATAFTVTVSAAAVAPAVAGDFTLSASPVLSFAANEASSTGTVTITASDNTVDAPYKTVTVSAAVSSTSLPPPFSVPLTIADDDPGVCDRTREVHVELARLASQTSCTQVTATHLAAITDIRLNDKGLTSLRAGDFEGLTGLTTLWLHDNSLSSLPADVFDGLANLTTLFLHRNSLSSLPPTVFSGLTNLTQLAVNVNPLSSLPANVFSGLTSLRTLWLRDTPLSSLPPGLFSGLASLTTLYMERNSLSSLPAGVFSNLANLSRLELQDNSLSSLPAGVFSGVTSLSSLNLRGNSLSSLPAGAFWGLARLRELNLVDHSLSSLPADAFSGLTSLTWLGLGHNSGHNSLSSLPAGVFDGLTSLTRLELHRNRLSSLPAGVFDDLTSLEDLYLHRNRLSSLPAGVFDGLASLEKLHLSRNSLSPLPAGSFASLTSLESLHLDWNPQPSLPLRVELERRDDGSDSGEVRAVARMEAGAPFDVTAGVTVSGGSSVAFSTIPKGGTESAEFTVTRNGTDPVRVSLGALPELPAARCDSPNSQSSSCYYGFFLEPGPPLEAYEQVKLVLSPASIAENGGVSTVTATVSPPSAAPFTVTVSATATAPATAADFTLSGTTLSFAAGAAASTGAVTIAAVDDATVFPPSVTPGLFEDKRVVVSGAVSASGITAPLSSELVIEDDEAPAVTASFAARGCSVAEGSRVEVRVRLSADPKRRVVIPLDANYRDLDSQEFSAIPFHVIFAGGETETSFPFAAFRDQEGESGEEAVVYLSRDDLPSKVSVEGPVVLRVTDSGASGCDGDDDDGGDDDGDGGGGGGGGSPPPPGGGGGGGTPPPADEEDDDGEEDEGGDDGQDGDGGDDGDGGQGGDDGDGGGGSPPPSGGGGGGTPPPADEEDDDGEEDEGGDDGDGGQAGEEDEDDEEEDGGPPRAAFTVDVDCADDLCRALTGVPVTFTDTSMGTVRSRAWEFGDGEPSRSLAAEEYAWSVPGFHEVALTVSDGSVESTATRTFLVEASDPAGACEPNARTRCLLHSRYEVTAEWWTADGNAGDATVVRAGTNDSGLFTFFDAANWEVLVKVLDGCALNGHVWVFGASTTDLGYRIAVADTVTGTVREYRNEPGLSAPAITDVRAFAESCRR